jgi:hypothetical protein
METLLTSIEKINSLILLTIIILLFHSCNSNKFIVESKNEKDCHYYKEYKNIFLIECLRRGYNNSLCINDILSLDASTMHELPPNLLLLEEINNLAIYTTKIIKMDSIKRNELVYDDGPLGKINAIHICLDFYNKNSKLDSLARLSCK